MAVFILPTARAIFPKNARKESPEAETGRKTAKKAAEIYVLTGFHPKLNDDLTTGQTPKVSWYIERIRHSGSTGSVQSGSVRWRFLGRIPPVVKGTPWIFTWKSLGVSPFTVLGIPSALPPGAWHEPKAWNTAWCDRWLVQKSGIQLTQLMWLEGYHHYLQVFFHIPDRDNLVRMLVTRRISPYCWWLFGFFPSTGNVSYQEGISICSWYPQDGYMGRFRYTDPSMVDFFRVHK